jgi:hypothetical protein
MRVRLGLGLAAGGGAASPSVLAKESFSRSSSSMPQSTNKNSAVRHAEPLVFKVEKRQT